MDQLISVSVMIPRSELSTLYGLCEHLCSEFERELERVSRPPEWRDDQEGFEKARELYWSVSKGAQAILDWFIDHPAQEIETDQLVTGLGMSTPARVNGTLSSIVRHANNAGMPPPYSYAKDGGFYYMQVECANVFRRARKEGRPLSLREVLEGIEEWTMNDDK